jgi:hypothetical protein
MREKLDQEDCIEIFYALDTKRNQIIRGDFNAEDSELDGPDTAAKEWATHLESIMKKIGVDGEQLARHFNDSISKDED